MTTKIALFLLTAAVLPDLKRSAAFVAPRRCRRKTSLLAALDRRAFFSASTATFVSTLVATTPSSAADTGDTSSDLTSQLFNPDGSLKDATTETEAKFRSVELAWDATEKFGMAVDGQNLAGTPSGSSVLLSYQLPEKWVENGSDLYSDRTAAGAKACDRITVYRAPGAANLQQLEKASTMGIGKALRVTDVLSDIESADLIGGRAFVKNGQKYFEFDMAVAPASCESSKEDLGLGFCPYDTIYLLSASVLDDRLYVFAVQSDKSEWKRANSDLRRLRSSFSVQQS